MTAVNEAFHRVEQALGAQQVDPDVGSHVIAALAAGGHELRVWVDTANNFGHHSTTMNMLKRIIGFGFNGPVRVFVGEQDAVKLELFLPGYKQGAKQLTYQGVTITFQYQGTPPDWQPLLISGGSEADSGELEKRLALANCGYYLQLQPWFWEKGHDYLCYTSQGASAVTSVLLDREKTLGSPAYVFRAYTEQAPARDDATWDRYGELPQFTARVAMAKLIAQRLTDHASSAIYLQPSYGLSIASDQWSALLTLILGGLATQDLMPSRGLTALPIVLLVFDKMDPGDWTRMRGWLAGTADEKKYPSQLRDYVRNHDLAKRLEYQYLDDVSRLKDQLSYTTGDRMLVVAMPSCPDEIFRYFYAAASLPCVFEGRGTQNLVLNTGQPYLCTNRVGYPGPAFNGDTPPAAQQALDVVTPLRRPYKDYANADASQFPSARYANALCALLQDEGALAYFQSLKASYGNPAHDKLRMALRFLRSVPGWTL